MRLGKVTKGSPSNLKPDAITNHRSSSRRPCFARNCNVLVSDWQKIILTMGDNGVYINAV